MPRKEKTAFGNKLKEGWNEGKLAEWKAGWKAKTAHWKKTRAEAGLATLHSHNKKGRNMGKLARFLNRNRAPETETELEVIAPPKRKRKTETERLQTSYSDACAEITIPHIC